MSINNACALITGATSGIGYELAKLFAQNNYDLIIDARSEEELNRTSAELERQYNIKVITIAKDLCKQDAAFELCDELKDTGVTITALLPGATDTDFFNKAEMQESKLVQEHKLDDPAKVAKDGFAALMSGDDKVVSGFKNKMQVAMSNVMPDDTVAE